MQVDLPLIEQLVTDVCINMLGLTTSTEYEAGRSHATDRIAAIHISGDWEALVEVHFTESAAGMFAANMFAKEPAELTEDDIRDAAGEIVNMLGGNLKGMIPGESNLSLPCVGLRTEKYVSPEYAQSASGHFRCEGQQFRVSVLQPHPELASASA